MKGITIAQIPQLLYVCMIIVAFVGAAYIMAESFQTTTYVATNVVNETINFAVNNTDYSFTNPYLTNGGVISVKNTTYTVPSTKYLVTNSAYHTYVIRLFTNGTIVVGNYNVSYTYNKDSKASTSIGYVIAFIDAIISNLPTVGIIIFIVLLVGAVMWIRKGQKTQGGA